MPDHKASCHTKPCPFCAGNDLSTLPVHSDGRLVGFRVRCQSCHAQVDSVGFFPEDATLRRAAIERWNTRLTREDRLDKARALEDRRQSELQIVEARRTAQSTERASDLTSARAWRELLVRRVVRAIAQRGDMLSRISRDLSISRAELVYFGRTLRCAHSDFLLDLERWLDSHRIMKAPGRIESIPDCPPRQQIIDEFLGTGLESIPEPPKPVPAPPRMPASIRKTSIPETDLPTGLPPRILVYRILQDHGWSVDAWCTANDMPRQYLDELLENVSLDAAWRLTGHFGYSPDFWTGLYAAQDDRLSCGWHVTMGLT